MPTCPPNMPRGPFSVTAADNVEPPATSSIVSRPIPRPTDDRVRFGCRPAWPSGVISGHRPARRGTADRSRRVATSQTRMVPSGCRRRAIDHRVPRKWRTRLRGRARWRGRITPCGRPRRVPEDDRAVLAVGAGRQRLPSGKTRACIGQMCRPRMVGSNCERPRSHKRTVPSAAGGQRCPIRAKAAGSHRAPRAHVRCFSLLDVPKPDFSRQPHRRPRSCRRRRAQPVNQTEMRPEGGLLPVSTSQKTTPPSMLAATVRLSGGKPATQGRQPAANRPPFVAGRGIQSVTAWPRPAEAR